MTDLPRPPPPISAEVDLTAFAYMPLEIARLRRSKAWLICKRRPDLAFYMINLWTASWHETPAGSLENDDDVLADVAMCAPEKWPKLKADVLRGWTECSDSRLYHEVVVEKAAEAWRSKLMFAYEKECDRLRKAAQRAKQKDFVPPTFEEWDAVRLSRGNPELSNGRPGLSSGRPKDIQTTSHVCPPENALKVREGKEREGKGDMCVEQGRPEDTRPKDSPGTRHGDEPPEEGDAPDPRGDEGRARGNGGQPGDSGIPGALQPRASLTLDQAQQLQRAYPVGIYRQSEWLVAEKLINQHLANGVAFETILASFERYRAQCEARECLETQYVLSPVKHCDRETPQFHEPFPIPRTKAEARQDANIDAGQQWLEESTRAAQ